MKNKRVVIALGGNALQGAGQKGTFSETLDSAQKAMFAVAKVIDQGDMSVVISHGNGPQVGSLLIQGAKASEDVPEMPMHVDVAMTQGSIGYFLTRGLKQAGVKQDVATVVTHVVVNPKSEAFKNPRKPVGPFFSKPESEALAVANANIVFKEDAGRGYRRVVPSPDPENILEIQSIETLLDTGVVVIACGGGGIPVYMEGEKMVGVDAVIDKDKTSALLADNLDAEKLVILTAVDEVSVHFGTPEQSPLNNVSVREVQELYVQGEFAEGSMKPKIEAALMFLKGKSGREVIITSPEELADAIRGKGGTRIG